ncbi:unnamed protein product [Durusdinium trenchii]|uniref:URB1 N-terminal domain-containing protein n=1 Tax=Durusdinium trenchii TaxID=1381693 RepID=A0ABP0KPF4_9DINO
MLSIAEEPDEAFKSPMAEETPLNPFEDDEPDEPFEHLSGRRATAVSFAPPTRARVNSRNPFGEDAWEEASLGSEDLPAGHMDSGGGCSFGRASGGILPLPEMSEESSSESKAAERRAAVNAISDEKAAAAVEEAEEAKAEVQRLRRALISEEQACAEARADRAELEVAASGSDASDSARLRLLLSEEKAKSRALGEKALRSERHRQKLLEEMVQDGQVDVELVSLAKAVGRTVKAISAISQEASAGRGGQKQTAEAALAGLCAELRSGQVNLLNEYVQMSPQCAELFTLWENQESGDGNRLVTLVIETLACVLEGKFDEGARTAKTRHGVAAKVLSEHLQLLYRYLGTERDQLLKVCLRLLAGVSSTSQALSAQLLRSFNFGFDGFGRLSGRRYHVSKKDKGRADVGKVDVRSYFSSFAMSFLRWKDPAMTSSALGIKDLVGGVLRGLSQDPPEQALGVVRDILELVVRLRQLPRQAKVFFFNAFALRNLCSLLGSEHKEVSASASELLKEVCCSTQLFPPHKEELLLDICLELRPHEPQQDLVIAVLRSHPALHLQFCSRLKLPLQPRFSRGWLLNVRFLRTLLEMDVSSVRSEALTLIGSEKTEAIQELRLSWIQEALVPKAMQKTLITQALLQKNAVVQLGALQLLIAALDRLQRAFSFSGWETAEREELLQRTQQQLPELNTFLLLWQRLSKEEASFDLKQQGSTSKRAQPLPEGEDGLEAEAPQEENGEGEALQVTPEEVAKWLGLKGVDLPPHLVFTSWCKSVQRYLEVLPQSALDIKFDWSKLLSAVAAPILDSKGAPCFERALACVSCVAPAMRARAESMQLSKSQRSWLETLLRLRSADVCTELRQECTEQTVEFLLGRGLLGSDEKLEIKLLLTALEKRPQCVGFLGQVLQALFARPGYFMSLVEAPSLLPVALLQHLTRRDPQSLALPGNAPAEQRLKMATACSKMVKQFLLLMATSLPETAKPLLSVVRGIGEWRAGSVSTPEEQAKETVEGEGPQNGIEEIRQQLLEKLQSKKRKRDEDPPVEAVADSAQVDIADEVLNTMVSLRSKAVDTHKQRFLELDANQRLSVLHGLVKTPCPAIPKVICWDRMALVRLALTTELLQFRTPELDSGLTLPMVSLFQQLSWIHPQIRKALALQLSWLSGKPAAVLRLAAALAPEPLVALDGAQTVTAASLQPLPPEDSLRCLFASNHAPVLEKLVIAALEEEEGGAFRCGLRANGELALIIFDTVSVTRHFPNVWAPQALAASGLSLT